MGAMASQITSLTIVYSTVYSDADQRKHQNSASLAFVWGIHRDRWIPRTKGQLRGKCFHLMTSSCNRRRWKKISKLRVTGLCEGNPPVTGRFLSQKVNDAEKVSIWWRHHENRVSYAWGSIGMLMQGRYLCLQQPRTWHFKCGTWHFKCGQSVYQGLDISNVVSHFIKDLTFQMWSVSFPRTWHFKCGQSFYQGLDISNVVRQFPKDLTFQMWSVSLPRTWHFKCGQSVYMTITCGDSISTLVIRCPGNCDKTTKMWFKKGQQPFCLGRNMLASRLPIIMIIVIWLYSFKRIVRLILEWYHRILTVDNSRCRNRIILANSVNTMVADALAPCTAMMTSWKGNIFRVTGLLCGDLTGHRWIPRKKASDVELWCFLWSASE